MAAISPAESAEKANAKYEVTFRWTYIMLPAVLLFLSLVLTASFYHLLPPEVAYRFTNGTPESWMSRGAIIAWLLIPQFLLAIIAFFLVRMAVLSTRFWSVEGTPLKRLLPAIGNMVALPQAILFFAMLEIFLYNSYQIRLMPMWIFAAIIMVLGAIILGIFFIQTIRQFRRLHGKSLRER